MRYALQIMFPCTNNVAEYEALLHGLRIAKELGVSQLHCYDDTDIVIQQTMGTWDVNEPNLVVYRRLVDQVGGHFAVFEMEHIPRKKNIEADELARLTSKRSLTPPSVFLDSIHNPSIKPLTKIELASPPSLEPVQGTNREPYDNNLLHYPGMTTN